MSDQSQRTPDSRRRHGLTLGAASVVNGLTAYAIVAVGSWSFGADDFAPYANLWTILTLTLAAVTFPLQHWIIRTISVSGGERSVRMSIGRVAAAVATLSAGLGTLSWIMADYWFGGSRVFAVFAALLVVESGVIGVSRGILVGRGEIRRAALIMGGENLIRLVAGAVVILAGWGLTAFGASMLTGVFIVTMFPSSLRFRADGDGGVQRVIAVLSGIAGGTLLSQIILVASPLIVSVQTERQDLITAMFANTALARAPFLIALGVGLQATALMSIRYRRNPASVVRLTVGFAAVGAFLAGGAGLVFASLAPRVVPLLFGPRTALSWGDSFLIGFASSVAVISLFVTLTLVAMDRSLSITISWIAGVVAGGLMLMTLSGPVTTVTASAFAMAEVVALIGLTLATVFKSGDGVNPVHTLQSP